MDVKIVATRTCSHCPNLERELKDLGIEYEVLRVEDHPDMVKKYGIRHSPNLVVDDEVIFRRQPSEQELKAFFAERKS
jgi:glutaredoxin